MKKIFLSFGMLLVFGLASVMFTSCGDKDNEPLPPDTENPTATQYDWIQVTSHINYKADGVTESNRHEFSYDTDGKEIGSKAYSDGRLIYQSRDYQYNGKTVILYRDSYTNGSLASTVKEKRTYFEKNWIQATSYIHYKADGVTESVRYEYSYDTDGKEIGYRAYSDGQLTSQSHDYQYDGKVVVFYTDGYSNGSLASTVKRKTTYR
jgi:hypothetical protein